MAGRNNLYLFAWLCAVALPLVLQWLSGTLPEVKDYLGYYYGWFSLFMFFALTYGFGAVFVAFYQISSYHKAARLICCVSVASAPGMCCLELSCNWS